MALVDTEQAEVGRRAYWDPEIYELELDRIFKKCWLFVAHESEVATRGDYVTRRMGEDPVIVTRDENENFRVFLNTCLHRGTQLCRADQGNTSHFRCSYHGWTYSNSGALQGVPEMKDVYPPDFNKADYRLIEPRVDVFQGLIFACWDPDAPALEEYLGDITWYLEAMVNKTDEPMEVLGPPARSVVRTNWKIGAENYGGDGYHLNTTHKTPIELGVFGTEHQMRQLGEIDTEGTTGHNVHGGNGNTVRIQQLPIKFEQPTFLGYPTEMWPEIQRNLTPGQADVMSGLAVMHGNVFPNFSFLEGVTVFAGDDTPPSGYIHLRQWQPLDVYHTELLVWCLVPKGVSQDWRQSSQRAFIRTLGLGGIFETDDFQNWTSMSDTNRGAVAKQFTYDYKGGKHLERANDVDWPGEVYVGDHTEVNQQAMYRRWGELMNELSNGQRGK